MKKTKGFRMVIMICIMAVLCASMPVPANAASAKSKAMKAYKKFLAGSAVRWSDSSTKKDTVLSKCTFALVYVDNNSVPELILGCGRNANSHAQGYYKMYTYKNGKVTPVMNLMDGFAYYKKKGVCCAFHSGTGGYETYYYKYSSGKSNGKLISVDRTPVSLTDPGWRYYNMKNNMLGSEISKASFNRQLKKLVGSSKKITKIKYYNNTAANRKKLLK